MRPRDLVNRVLSAGGVALVRHPAADSGLDEHLRALIGRLDINCVVDVGAHRGGYGGELRDLGYRGHIVSFEPHRPSFERLEEASAADERWRAHRMALGSEAGSLALNVTKGTSFASFLQPSEWGRARYPDASVEGTETVRVERLDSLFDEVTRHVSDPRVLLKADTQGWDLEVVKGTDGCLPRVLALQIELSVRPVYDGMTGWLEALPQLSQLGYDPVHLATESRDERFRITELNCLMTRASA